MNDEVAVTIYESLGGESVIRHLVQRLYELMDELPEANTVRRIHPESLKGSEAVLFEYLSGWFGGPNLYIEKNGHPRLRMRHAPYAIGLVERNEWMLCMKQSLTENVADETLRKSLINTFSQMATHLVNTD